MSLVANSSAVAQLQIKNVSPCIVISEFLKAEQTRLLRRLIGSILFVGTCPSEYLG